MFRPPSLLAPQIVPTAANAPAGQPGLLRPSRTRFVTSPRIGYANRPMTGNWRYGDLHPARLRPCRLLLTPRPPHGSVRAPLCIRLLPRVPDGETLVGPGMKDSRLWEPVVRQLRHSSPGKTAFLTASAECPAPAFGDLGSKGSQRSPVGWDCVVVEEAGDVANGPRHSGRGRRAGCLCGLRRVRNGLMALSIEAFDLDHPAKRVP